MWICQCQIGVYFVARLQIFHPIVDGLLRSFLLWIVTNGTTMHYELCLHIHLYLNHQWNHFPKSFKKYHKHWKQLLTNHKDPYSLPFYHKHYYHG